jgi:hypothetical protein
MLLQSQSVDIVATSRLPWIVGYIIEIAETKNSSAGNSCEESSSASTRGAAVWVNSITPTTSGMIVKRCQDHASCHIRCVPNLFGGAERDRTADLLVANEALSQLSYSPTPQVRAARSHSARSSLAGDTPLNQALATQATTPGLSCKPVLGSTFRRSQPHLRHNPLQVFPCFRFLTRISKQKSRMVRNSYFGIACRVPRTAE